MQPSRWRQPLPVAAAAAAVVVVVVVVVVAAAAAAAAVVAAAAAAGSIFPAAAAAADTPFAAVFTLSSLMGAYLINYYFQPDQETKVGNNKATQYTILYGILLGLTSGIRIGAFLILFFFLTSYLLIWWEQGRKKQPLINFLGLYILMGITWAIIHSICYPAFWGNPIAGFFETLDYLSSHRLQITVLFRGWDFPIQKIPRGYLLTWIFMAIPLIFHLGFNFNSEVVFVSTIYQSFRVKSGIYLIHLWDLHNFWC